MNNIEKIKKKKCMSYEDIAKETNVTAQYIFLLAKGQRKNPSLEVMKSIAHALDEKVEKVFQINQEEGVKMSNLLVKSVDFFGDELIAIKNEDNKKMYTGVSFICNGLGLTKGQKDRQVLNIQEDLVLKRGCLKFEAGVIDPNNEVLGIELDFLPLWLAKISITPKMQEQQPKVAEKLVNYQLKAKDVLAQAFVKPMSKELQAIFMMDSKQQQMDARITKLENNTTIDYSQQEELRVLGTKKVIAILGGNDAPAYKELNKKVFSSFWRDYKRKLNVNSYKNTLVKDFEMGRQAIINWNPSKEIKFMIDGCNAQIRM